MWCRYCQQDVPGIVAKGDGKLCCIRCSTPIGEDRKSVEYTDGSTATSDRSGVEVEGETGQVAYDSWEAEEQLRHIGRRLHRGRDRQAHKDQVHRRLDAAHAQPSGRHLARSPGKVKKGLPRQDKRDFLLVPTWSALTLGFMMLVCGGILLVWSVLGAREELWPIGLPIAIGGQVALLVGLVLQLDRLWWRNCHTADKLETVDRQVRDLRHATTLLGTTHGSPAASFYAHYAGGAHPQLLLTDLKSQLDLLAVKIGRE